MKPTHEGGSWAVYNADCVEILVGMPDESIDAAVFSSPFSSLYIYSDSERDMGNAASHEEFLEHHAYMARELYRVMKPGAVICDHVKDTVFYANSSETGESGLYPFSDAALANYRQAGFVLRARTTVWRCPVRERSKSNPERLLYKNIGENSRVCAPGMPEYILVMRKDAQGVRTGDPVRHAVAKWTPERYQRDALEIGKEHAGRLARVGLIEGWDDRLVARLAEAAKFPLDQWQEWASPVWMDTRTTEVLNSRFKGDGDEKHICPMPLDLIERCLALYSNPGDLVIDPFNGIGSTGYQAVKMGRRYIGIELKPEYAKQAARFLEQAEGESATLFSLTDSDSHA
jgi:DNA modification methylase